MNKILENEIFNTWSDIYSRLSGIQFVHEQWARAFIVLLRHLEVILETATKDGVNIVLRNNFNIRFKLQSIFFFSFFGFHPGFTPGAVRLLTD